MKNVERVIQSKKKKEKFMILTRNLNEVVLTHVTDKDVDKKGCFRVPKDVTIIYSDAFKGCSSLKTLRIPKSVKKIAPRAFAGCENLSLVIFEEKFPQMDEGIFGWLPNLQEVKLVKKPIKNKTDNGRQL